MAGCIHPGWIISTQMPSAAQSRPMPRITLFKAALDEQ
jgi:hypothetical protein